MSAQSAFPSKLPSFSVNVSAKSNNSAKINMYASTLEKIIDQQKQLDLVANTYLDFLKESDQRYIEKKEKAREERIYTFEKRSPHYLAVDEFKKEVCVKCVNRLKCSLIKYKMQYKSINLKGGEPKTWYSMNRPIHWNFYKYRIGCKQYVKLEGAI